MVYKGPSRGCYECRKRRVKCDEARPQCGNCRKRKHDCPGYRDFFDAVHKDETSGFSHRSVPKRHKRALALIEDSSDSSPEQCPVDEIVFASPTTVASPVQWLPNNTSSEISLLLKPSRDVSLESLCYFFTNYVNTPRDPSTNIFVEHILPMYLNTAPDSALTEAIHAVAINVTSVWMNRFVDSWEARQAYTSAVSRLKVSLQDPVESRTDETLATVFMLDFYDTLNQRFVQFGDSGTHQQGAVALLKHRGQDNFKTPLSQRLFNAMRSRHINYSLQFGRDVQLDPELLADDTAILPSAKLDLLNVKLAKLHKLARDGPESATLSVIEFHELLLETAIDLELQFQAWLDGLPKSWKPMAIPASSLHPSIVEAGVYEGMCDVYSSLAVSHVQNSSRSSHVGILRLIVVCVQRMRDLGVEVDPEIENNVYVKMQEVVDRFCASIPFHMGNRTDVSFPHERREYPEIPAELRKLANYVDPFGNEAELTMEDHSRAAAAIGGWFIMTPLAGFLRAPSLATDKIKPGPLARKLRDGQITWIRGQMRRIQKIYLFPTDGSQQYVDWTWFLKSYAATLGTPMFSELLRPPLIER